MLNAIVKDWHSVAMTAGTLLGAFILGLVIYHFIFKIARRGAKRAHGTFEASLVKHCRGPAKISLPFLMAYLFLPLTPVGERTASVIERAFGIILVLAVAWLVIKLTYVFEDVILARFKIETGDHLRARKIGTQIQVLRKVVAVIVAVIAVAVILMSFETVRYLGKSILASAGIAGIVFGLAAQRSIGSLIAGIQIALTEPIRIDDVVIAENEWGWIEEINLTYVVLRTWDLRRLIFPITYFLEKPFQNWTRQATELLGTVFIYVDYSVPLDPVREELDRILKDSKLWDRRASGMQLTNASEHTVELRALVSAKDSSDLWDLRCEVREKLIEFVRSSYPHGLPRIRAEISEREKSR